MKNIMLSLMIFFIISMVLSAEDKNQDTLYLKNGKKVSGTIVNIEPNESVYIKISDTIYTCNINRIDSLKGATAHDYKIMDKIIFKPHNKGVVGINPDTLYLKNGRKVCGTIVNIELEENIDIKIGDTTYTCNMNRIDSLINVSSPVYKMKINKSLKPGFQGILGISQSFNNTEFNLILGYRVGIFSFGFGFGIRGYYNIQRYSINNNNNNNNNIYIPVFTNFRLLFSKQLTSGFMDVNIGYIDNNIFINPSLGMLYRLNSNNLLSISFGVDIGILDLGVGHTVNLGFVF